MVLVPSLGTMTIKKVLLLFFVIMSALGLFSPTHAQPPANDLCVNAVPITAAFGDPTSGTTTGATAEDPDGLGSCGPLFNSPGVWYTVTGTGNGMTATTCVNTDPDASANYDTKISVFCKGCSTPLCVGGNDDVSGCNFRSTFSWGSQAGVTYYVIVHGYGSQTGDFNLVILDDGTPATATVDCIDEEDGGLFDFLEGIEDQLLDGLGRN